LIRADENDRFLLCCIGSRIELPKLGGPEVLRRLRAGAGLGAGPQSLPEAR